MDAVVKAGGSLAEQPEALKTLCVELSRLASRWSVVVVPGGGRFADVVREMDAKFCLPAAVSHRLAIQAMDQYGLVLTQLIPKSATCVELKEACRLVDEKKVAVFLPSQLMLQDDPFESSWDVTSDSIAAYIALKLRAAKLVLATDVDGVFTEDPKKHSNAKLLGEVTPERLQKFVERTSVDKALPVFLQDKQVDCYVVNGLYPERIGKVLSGQEKVYTRIRPSSERL